MSLDYTIYLVDDDRFLLDLYAAKFREAGHEVTEFQNPEEAIGALRSGPPPTAMLLDIVMPEMDGFEVLEAIRAEKLAPGTKIIVFSNQGQEKDIERAKALGAAGYITKASAIPSEVYAETIAIIEKQP